MDNLGEGYYLLIIWKSTTVIQKHLGYLWMISGNQSKEETKPSVPSKSNWEGNIFLAMKQYL